MWQLRKIFELETVYLSDNESFELNEQLRLSDYQRIYFLAIVSIIITLPNIIVNIVNLRDNNYQLYLFSDSILFFVSALVLIISNIHKTSLRFKKIETLLFHTYLIVCTYWATSIAVINQAQSLNIFTFFITMYIILFYLTLSARLYMCTYIAMGISYIISCQITDTPIFSDVLVTILVASLLAIPLFITYKSARKNAKAAILKLNKTNHSLEDELSHKYESERLLNENLQNEITQRKVVEKKLLEALEKAEANSKLKSEFLSNISHEIRTPLNTIIGFSEMLTEEGVPDKQKKEFHKLIGSNTMSLLSIIDDIFDASLIQTNQIKTLREPFNINNFIDAINYETNGIAIKYNSPPIKLIINKLNNNNTSLLSDEYYLKTAFLRLVDNAYKFTKKGNITIGAVETKSGIELYVKDSGIGISANNQEKVFEPFVQIDGSFTRGYGGTGLGLNIVKGIIEHLDCTLSLHSEPEIGSTFSICFSKASITQSSKV